MHVKTPSSLPNRTKEKMMHGTRTCWYVCSENHARTVWPQIIQHFQNDGSWQNFRKLIKILLEWICQPEGACLVHTHIHLRRHVNNFASFSLSPPSSSSSLSFSVLAFGVAHFKEWQATPRQLVSKRTWYTECTRRKHEKVNGMCVIEWANFRRFSVRCLCPIIRLSVPLLMDNVCLCAHRVHIDLLAIPRFDECVHCSWCAHWTPPKNKMQREKSIGRLSKV